MTIHKGHKYRIYPTSEQKVQFEKTFGCCRFVYNDALSYRKDAYLSEKRSVSQYECMKKITQMRSDKDTLWLSEVDSMALQEAVKDLNKAYQGFFKKMSGYPKYKKKYSYEQSYRTRNQGNGIRIVDDKHIKLPIVGIVKARISRLPEGRILNATVSKTASGKYYVSLCCEEELTPKPNLGCITGLDVGIKSFYTDSNGLSIDAPKPLNTHIKKLKKEQRKLSRMIEANISGYGNKRRPIYKRNLSECKNIQKQRMKIACIHEKIANIRNDFLHKTSTALVSENQVICVEDLNVKGMIKNHKLSKTISDVSWSKFFSMLEYKAFEHGCEIIKIPTFYPSSQTCSVCGEKNSITKNLKVREWDCPKCGTHHNRDHNAAINILNKGLELLNTA